VADSNGQQNRKPEEPDARNGRVRICGGAFGGIRGATRQRPPPHFVGPLHLFRFSLDQASLRAEEVATFCVPQPLRSFLAPSAERKTKACDSLHRYGKNTQA
jgi:hypothetical protein